MTVSEEIQNVGGGIKVVKIQLLSLSKLHLYYQIL